MLALLETDEIERIERENPAGLPARVIVEIFQPRGIRLSEATFRKYVQVGLLPRSRRVGRKGKHRGSQGVYPVGTVRRINVIKRMMEQGLTIEEIRGSFVYFRNEIDQLERALDDIFRDFERQIQVRELPEKRKKALERALKDLREQARALVVTIERAGSQIAARATAAVNSPIQTQGGGA